MDHGRASPAPGGSDDLDETARPATSDLALGRLIKRLRTEAGISQQELAARVGTTQSGISRLERGDGTRNRLDTLARVAVAIGRHLVVSFPVDSELDDQDSVRIT